MVMTMMITIMIIMIHDDSDNRVNFYVLDLHVLLAKCNCQIAQS